MIPGKLDLSIPRGATLDELLTLYTDDAQTVLFDLTGYTARAQFREFAEEVDPPALDLKHDGPSTERLVLGGAAGTIAMQASVAKVNAVPWRQGVWALELTEPSGKVWPLLEGEADFEADVVR